MSFFNSLLLLIGFIPLNTFPGINNKIVFTDSLTKLTLLSESKMYFKGKTNINAYSCDCVSPSGIIPLRFENRNNTLYFQSSSVEIKTKEINCHKEIYNQNIKKTLDSEHFPAIKISVLEAWKVQSNNIRNTNSWFEVSSKTELSIKNVKRTEIVNAKAIQITANKYRIVGSKVINMKKYNLDAPEFLFGMIKIKDELVFHFDLVIELN